MSRFFGRPGVCTGQPAKVLKQLFELLHAQAGIANDVTHRYCMHRIIPWDGNKTDSVRHDDVFALADYLEARFFQRSHGAEVRSAGILGNSECHLYFPED